MISCTRSTQPPETPPAARLLIQLHPPHPRPGPQAKNDALLQEHATTAAALDRTRSENEVGYLLQNIHCMEALVYAVLLAITAVPPLPLHLCVACSLAPFCSLAGSACLACPLTVQSV